MILTNDALKAANTIVTMLEQHNFGDYSRGRDEIARVFDENLWNNAANDAATDFDTSLGVRNLRFVHDEEYEGPTNLPIFHASNYYVFLK